MRWSDLDLDGETPMWTLPAEATKAGRVHDVTLSPEVVAILAGLPRFGGDYVFSTTGGERPISGFSPIKKRLDELMRARLPETRDWVIHDLRRSAATNMAKFGFGPHVVGAVLNHSPGTSQGVTSIYLRHRYTEERRAALSAWAAQLVGLVEERPGNVVALRGGAS